MDLLTYREAATKYRCSAKTLERAVKRGLIDAYRPGQHVVLDADTVEVWFKGTKQQPVRSTGGRRKRTIATMPT